MKRRVIKQYEFVRKLGSGGSGVVFLANDTQLQRPVVLKLLKKGEQTADQVRTTQLREARLASATVVFPWIISKTSADLRRAVHRLISSSITMLMRLSKQDYT